MGFYADNFDTLLSQQEVPASDVQPGGPLISNLPRARKALSTKLTSFYDPAEQMQDWGPGTIQALKKVDDLRVLRGQNPMSQEETAAALKASQPTDAEPLGRAVTERPDRRNLSSLPGNVLTDLSDLFRSLPSLPGALLHQVQDLPNVGQRLDEAIKDPSKLGNVPGLGLVPGVYTAGNILSGDPGAILEHPLFTALDLAPYAKARVFTAPESWVKEGARVAQEAGDAGVVAGATKPRSLYQEVFPSSRYSAREARRMQGITSTGQTGKANIIDLLADTAPGKALARERDILRIRARGTAMGNEVSAGLGKEVRSLMQARDQISRGIFDVVNDPDSPIMKTMLGDRFATYKPAIEANQRHLELFGNKFGTEHYGSPETWAARRTELGNIVEHHPDQIPSLPAHEQAFIESTQKVNDLIIRPLTSNDPTRPAMFGEVTVPLPDGTEHQLTTTWKAATKIWDQQTKAAMHADTVWLKDAVTNPGTYTADDILAHANQSAVLRSPAIPIKGKINVIEGYVHALNAIGVDARPLLADIRKAKMGQVPGEVLDWLNTTEFAQLDGRIPISIDEIADTLRYQNKGGYTQWYRGKDMKTPDMVGIKKQLDLFRRGGMTRKQLTLFKADLNRVFDKVQAGKLDAPDSFRALDIDKASATIDILKRRRTWERAEQTRQWADPKYTGAAEKASRLTDKTPDQRLVPMLQEQAHQRMVQTAENLNAELGLGQAGDDLVAAVRDRQHEALQPYLADNVAVEDLWKSYVKEANQSWRQMAADLGPDNMPRFVHHVPAERAQSSQFINISLGGKKPASWKARTMDLTPYSRDMSLAANANVIEHLVKQGDDYLLDIIQHGDQAQGWTPWATTQGELLNRLRPMIDRERTLHPDTPYDTIAERILKRTYTQVDIDPIKKLTIDENGLKGYASGASDSVSYQHNNLDQLWMPRSTARAVQQMRTPMRARAVWDPLMSTFRTSALILSPRWQVYNILGNGFLGVMSNGWEFLRQMPEAKRNLDLIRKFEDGATIPPNLRTSLAGRTPGELVLNEVASEGWEKTFQLAGKSGQSAYTTWQKTRIPGQFSRIKDWSIGMNAYMDDLSRISNYLAGEKKVAALMKKPGVAEAFDRQAQALGEATGVRKEVVDRDVWEDPETGTIHSTPIEARPTPSTREWTQAEAENAMLEATYNWSSMTPWERSTARNIFPFYGFYSHILRYAGKYALDHPFRVAIFAGFARAELEDWGTGLPERLHNYFVLNRDRDEEGNITGYNMAGWSPFANTADLFTISGWVNQVNPLLSTLAQQLGVDPRTGEAGTYPATAYDPETGRLSLQPPDLATSLIQNLIPQTQALAAVTGLGDDEQRRTSPDSYTAQIRSSLGIPSLWRSINVPQETAYNEAAALNARQQAEAEAYKSGGTPSKYPVLAAQITQKRTLQELSPSSVAQFTPPNTSPGIFDLVKRAVIPGG